MTGEFQHLVEQKRQPAGGPVKPVPQPLVDVPAALKEITTTTLDGIQVETASKWAARALAYYSLALRSPNRGEMTQYLCMGDTCREEALEHAAQTQTGPQLVDRLRKQMDADRGRLMQLILA